jgi:hypothetical protein
MAILKQKNERTVKDFEKKESFFAIIGNTLIKSFIICFAAGFIALAYTGLRTLTGLDKPKPKPYKHIEETAKENEKNSPIDKNGRMLKTNADNPGEISGQEGKK